MEPELPFPVGSVWIADYSKSDLALADGWCAFYVMSVDGQHRAARVFCAVGENAEEGQVFTFAITSWFCNNVCERIA